MSDVGPYERLKAGLVAETVVRLQERIHARFGLRGLTMVAGDLAGLVPKVADGYRDSTRRVRRTRLWSRGASLLVLLAVVVALGFAVSDAITRGPERRVDWVPLVESTANDIVFAAIVVLFLWALPERLERRYLLALLHRLRSLAHVVDMHQLTKDPEQVLPAYRATDKSVRHQLDADGMRHYLDYCSELLSLVAKTAALTAEHTADPVVLGTVSDIEKLTAEMSAKIWQKISLLPTGA